MLGQTPEGSLEQLVPERDFANLLGSRAQDLLRLTNTLSAPRVGAWTKRLFFLLYSEADELESFLDDYGARHNQTYAAITELTASVRGFAMAGLSLEHLTRRVDTYGVLESFSEVDADLARGDLLSARSWVQEVLLGLLGEIRSEAERHGVHQPEEGHAEGEPGSEEHTSELQSRRNLVCRLLLEKKKKNNITTRSRTTDYALNANVQLVTHQLETLCTI